MKFPRDASQRKVIKALEALGFKTVRVGNHISMRGSSRAAASWGHLVI